MRNHHAAYSQWSPEARKRNVEYLRRRRLSSGAVPLGNEILCEECSLPLIRTSSKRKLHTQCHNKRQAACCRRIQRERKIRVLTHYSTKGFLCCSWDGCVTADSDMLCLDHVQNNGYEERKAGLMGGSEMYTRLEKENFPSGFQTLCYNHNMKKVFLLKGQN